MVQGRPGLSGSPCQTTQRAVVDLYILELAPDELSVIFRVSLGHVSFPPEIGAWCVLPNEASEKERLLSWKCHVSLMKRCWCAKDCSQHVVVEDVPTS